MMVALYRRNGDLVIDWGRTMPFKYDFFQVRWDLNGRNVGQREIRGRVQGSTVVSHPQDGTYTAVVQGCDSRVLSSTRCRQKWTVPVSIQLPFHRPTVDASDALLVVNQHSKMCVDVAYGSRNQGARIQQYPCHGGPPERWRYDWVTTVNETGYFQIVNQKQRTVPEHPGQRSDRGRAADPSPVQRPSLPDVGQRPGRGQHLPAEAVPGLESLPGRRGLQHHARRQHPAVEMQRARSPRLEP